MMKKEYLVGMFVLCFFVWAVVVDNAVLPGNQQLRQDAAYAEVALQQIGSAGWGL